MGAVHERGGSPQDEGRQSTKGGQSTRWWSSLVGAVHRRGVMRGYFESLFSNWMVTVMTMVLWGYDFSFVV